MKVEDLKKTFGYKQLSTYASVYGAVGVLFSSFVIYGILDQVALMTILGLAFTGFLLYLCWHQLSMMQKIKTHAKSFEVCEAKAVNVATVSSNMRYNRLIFEFEDYMGESHRMESNNIVSAYELELYLEKTMDICYSPHFERVLIKEQLTKQETQKPEEKQEDDPYGF